MKNIKILLILGLLVLLFQSCHDSVNTKTLSPFDSAVNSGKKYLGEQNYKDARNSFLNAIEINPDNTDGHYGLLLADIGLFVDEIAVIVNLFTGGGSSPVLAKFKPQVSLDLKNMLSSYLKKLEEILDEGNEQEEFLIKLPIVSFKIDSFPISFNTSQFLGDEAKEKLGNTDEINLGGEWAGVELVWVGGMIRLIRGFIYLLYAHNWKIDSLPIWDPEAGVEVFFAKVLVDNPDFLGPDPDKTQSDYLFKVDDELGDAFILWSKVVAEANKELQNDSDLEDNIVVIKDNNNNKILDVGDGISLYKLLPIGINPDIANTFGTVIFSESMGAEVLPTIFDDFTAFLDAFGKSLLGTLGRNFSISKDINPLMKDTNQNQFADILELDLHALFDENNVEYLRALLPYLYFDNVNRNAYVFVIEHNDKFVTEDEIKNYAMMNTNFTGKVSRTTLSTDPVWKEVFCAIDTAHFDAAETNSTYSEVEGLKKIPSDCLIDINKTITVNSYSGAVTVSDHPSLVYLAWQDPTFSGLGYVNLDNWSIPQNYFEDIPSPMIPKELKGKGCVAPTQYSVNALINYFILFYEGQTVEIFGLNINDIFNNYKNVFSVDSPTGNIKRLK